MQNTRLNGLVDNLSARFEQWFRNPWRRTSALAIGVLFGNFLGTLIATTAGAEAVWDVIAAAIMVLLTELISRIAYSRNRELSRSLPVELLNALKLGLIYSLFVDAFKLGS